MAYRPAGYSDDDSDYDHYDDEDDYHRVSYNGDTAATGNDGNPAPDEIEWPNPRLMTPPIRDDVLAASQDIHSVISMIVKDDVVGIGQCLEIKKELINQTISGSPLCLSSGGSRLIFVACSMGSPEMLSLFLDRGASLDPDANDQLTPLMAICAASNNNRDEDKLLECAKLILKSGKVDVNARQCQKLTALMFAAKQGYDSLVKLLIEAGAQLNAVETQLWTALTFAVDTGYGHIVRRLLEAGANPDIATLDGQLPIDMAYERHNSELGDVIKAFANRPKLPVTDNPFTSGMMQKYSPLDNILLGLDASEYIPLFRHHGFNLETFLELTETDLEKIGVEKVGLRKKLAQGIVEIHKKDWEKSSLPKILPKDRQNGIYMTCPDAIVQLANISQHFRFLSANLQYLKRQLREKPEMLLIGKDIGDASHLLSRVKEARQNLVVTSKQLRELDNALSDACAKLKLELKPVDTIVSENNIGGRSVPKVSLAIFGLVSACVAIYYMMKG